MAEGLPTPDRERFARIAAAVEQDNGLAVQIATFTVDDVRWLVAKVRAEKAAAGEANDAIHNMGRKLGDAQAEIERLQEQLRSLATFAALKGRDR